MKHQPTHLTSAHRDLLRILAETAVDDYLRELAGQERRDGDKFHDKHANGKN